MTTIHTFSSTGGSGLYAFTDDAKGDKLPDRHGPWKHVGSVTGARALPHGIDRKAVEAAIGKQGFQMWRPRKAD